MTAVYLAAFLLMQNTLELLDRVGIDQKPGAQVSENIVLLDEKGGEVPLQSFLHRKPLLLTPVYFECPSLCTMQLQGLVRALRAMKFVPGEEFDILTVSIDPAETPELARARKAAYIKDYDKPRAAAGWHFLTGRPEEIRRLTEEIGFRYTFDSTTGQWAHASTLVVLTPDGRVSRYFNTLDYDPTDLKLALMEASKERIGSVVDKILLFCYRYDPSTQRYSLYVLGALRVASAATLAALAAFVLAASRKRQRPATG